MTTLERLRTASSRYGWAVPAVRSMLLELGDTPIDGSTASVTHLKVIDRNISIATKVFDNARGLPSC
jgi:hypothetical protein